MNSLSSVGARLSSGLPSDSAMDSVRFLFFADPLGVVPSSFGVAGVEDVGFLPKLSFRDGVLTGVCELGVGGCERGLTAPF